MLPARPRVGRLVPRFTSVSIEDESDATAARRAFNDARVDLVVVAPAMAPPPSLGAAVLVRPSWPAPLWKAGVPSGLSELGALLDRNGAIAA